jgi:carbohydrate-binding DOMON domain-containing protein
MHFYVYSCKRARERAPSLSGDDCSSAMQEHKRTRTHTYTHTHTHTLTHTHTHLHTHTHTHTRTHTQVTSAVMREEATARKALSHMYEVRII